MRILDHHEGHVPGPGLYRMTAEQYHADPCPEPSLSSGVARTIVEKTELHAWASHPRLGGEAEDPKSRKLDIGSVAHELLTGEGRGIHVITATVEKGDRKGEPVASYQGKAAQEERDAALARGETPVLVPDHERAERMVAAVRDRCAGIVGAEHAFRRGHGELVLIWRDRIGVWGRAMLDWLDLDALTVWDLKTTSAGLSDRDIAKRIAEGLDIQEAWYRRGLAHLMPEALGRARFNFVFVEVPEPHEARIVPLSGAQRYLGERRAVTAAVAFRECLRSGTWPGYSDTIAPVEPAGWAETRWLAQETDGPLFRRYGAQIGLALSPFSPVEDAA